MQNNNMNKFNNIIIIAILTITTIITISQNLGSVSEKVSFGAECQRLVDWMLNLLKELYKKFHYYYFYQNERGLPKFK